MTPSPSFSLMSLMRYASSASRRGGLHQFRVSRLFLAQRDLRFLETAAAERGVPRILRWCRTVRE
jgi:hypothetical protein